MALRDRGLVNDAAPKAAGGARRRRRGGRGRSGANAKAPEDLADVPFPEAEPVFASAPPVLAASNFIEGMGTPPPAGAMSQEEQKLALFIDIDNVVIGLRESGHPKFDVKLLISRLLEKGKIVIKRAYADWSRYAEYKRAFHESAFELIDIPQHRLTGKNSADIRMVVDAMDLASNKEHITTFVIGSGDSDFSPLVSKLKENNKHGPRLRREGLDLGAPHRQLRRVHLLRGPRPREDEDARLSRACPRRRPRRSRCSSTPSSR